MSILEYLWDDDDVRAVCRLCNSVAVVRYTNPESYPLIEETYCGFHALKRLGKVMK
jgi:hypothetical protein